LVTCRRRGAVANRLPRLITAVQITTFCPLYFAGDVVVEVSQNA